MVKLKKEPKKRNRSLKRLREIIQRTQSQFAAMVGVSVHSIISVENGRNRLTPKLSRKIYMATGAVEKSLARGDGKLTSIRGPVYTEADFDNWRTCFTSTEEEAIYRFKGAIGWVGLIFLAAAKSGAGKKRDRLPALCVEITHWLQDTVEDFHLKPEIDAILKEKTKGKDGWRKLWSPGGDGPSLEEIGIKL